jgi:hypothetical protein
MIIRPGNYQDLDKLRPSPVRAPVQIVTVVTEHLRVTFTLVRLRGRGIRHVDTCCVLHVQRN